MNFTALSPRVLTARSISRQDSSTSGKKYPSDAEILFRMSALFQILRHRVVVGAGKLATQVAVPGVKQFAVFGYEHMNIKPLPVHVMISSIEMPATFRRLVLDQGAVRQHRSARRRHF